MVRKVGTARRLTASAPVHIWHTPKVYYLSGGACAQRSRGPGRPAQGMACKGSVYALALNAPGSLVIAGTAESLVRVFDSRTGAKVMKLRGHTGNVRWAPIVLCPAVVSQVDARSPGALHYFIMDLQGHMGTVARGRFHLISRCSFVPYIL